MSSTALIIRPADAPTIHVLECDGPGDFAPVHRYPGTHRYPSFGTFDGLPDHSKHPGPSVELLDFNSACRIYRLIDHAKYNFGQISPEHRREIRGRLKVLFPGCDEDF